MTVLLPLLLTVATWSGTVEHHTSFGSLTLIQEQWSRDPGQPPIMHVPDSWKKLHLRWNAPVGDMAVSLVDDGYILSIAVSGHDCLSSGGYLHYRSRMGEPTLWGQMRAQMGELMRLCPRISRPQAAVYLRAFGTARDDFTASVEALKKRAVAFLGTKLARCRPPNHGLIFDPFASRCGKME
jgi:hypothetical protein